MMARLPNPGSDDGEWGEILNSFLSVEHTPEGFLKKSADITDAKLSAENALVIAQDAQAAADNAISQSTLDTDSTLAASSDSRIASQRAVKTYIDSSISSNTTVTSVNNQTSAVMLTTDNIADTATNRYVNNSQLTTLSNTSGTNTGDQDLTELVPNTRTVNGKSLSSNITLDKSDIGLSAVNNTSDLAKPISTAVQTGLDGKANVSHTHSTTQITGLAAVATSGSYSDLSNKPVVPVNASDVGAVATSSGITTVNAGNNLNTTRPAGVGLVYWLFTDSTVDTGSAGENITNGAPGDLWFVPDA